MGEHKVRPYVAAVLVNDYEKSEPSGMKKNLRKSV